MTTNPALTSPAFRAVPLDPACAPCEESGFGEFSLADLAQAVRLAAMAEAAGLADLEIIAARSPDVPTFARVLADVSRQGRALGAVHALIQRLMAEGRT